MADKQDTRDELEEEAVGQSEDFHDIAETEDGEDETYEIRVEGEDEPWDDEDKSGDAVSEQLARTREELAELRAQSSTSADFKSGIEDLVKSLRREEAQGGQAGAAAQAQRVTLEQVRKELSESDAFYKDPVAASERLAEAMMQERMGPVMQRVTQVLNETANVTSKSLAEKDSVAKFAIENYADEVEERAKQLPAGSDRYKKAAREIATEHMDEYISAQVEAKLAEATASTPKRAPSGALPAGARRGRAEGEKGRGKRVTLTQAQIRDAERRGLSTRDYVEFVLKK